MGAASPVTVERVEGSVRLTMPLASPYGTSRVTLSAAEARALAADLLSVAGAAERVAVAQRHQRAQENLTLAIGEADAAHDAWLAAGSPEGPE